MWVDPRDPIWWLLLVWCRVYWALVWLDRTLWRPIASLKS